MIQRNTSVILLLMFIYIVFWSPDVFSEKEKTDKVEKKKVDFTVKRLYSERCTCELQGVDGIYVNKVILQISNKSGAKEDAEVVLAFYDLVHNKNRKIVKAEKALKPGENRTITMLPRPALILKSIGISGIVTPKYKNFVEDIDNSNNSITIHECTEK